MMSSAGHARPTRSISGPCANFSASIVTNGRPCACTDAARICNAVPHALSDTKPLRRRHVLYIIVSLCGSACAGGTAALTAQPEGGWQLLHYCIMGVAGGVRRRSGTSCGGTPCGRREREARQKNWTDVTRGRADPGPRERLGVLLADGAVENWRQIE